VPSNECIPWQEDADRLPVQASAAITGKRFIKPSGARLSGPLIPATAQVGASDPVDGGRIQAAQCVAGDHSIGVSSWDMAVGEGGVAISEGVVPVTAGAAITAGQAVQSDANGAAIPLAAGVKLGTAVDSAANGADAQIKLVL
jgi:hypothetical protein